MVRLVRGTRVLQPVLPSHVPTKHSLVSSTSEERTSAPSQLNKATVGAAWHRIVNVSIVLRSCLQCLILLHARVRHCLLIESHWGVCCSQTSVIICRKTLDISSFPGDSLLHTHVLETSSVLHNGLLWE